MTNKIERLEAQVANLEAEIFQLKNVDLEREIQERKQAEQKLEEHREHLDKTVQERTNQLAKSNMLLQQQRTFADVLREINTSLNETLDLEEVLDRILIQIGRIVPYDQVSIMLIDGERTKYVRLRGYDDSSRIQKHQFELQETKNLKEIIKNKQTMYIPDVEEYEGWVKIAPTRSFLCTPILIQDKIKAFISIDKNEPRFYQPEHIDQLNIFAGQVAIAMEKAYLYQQAQEEIAERKRIEATLRTNEENGRLFQDKLQILHEINIELTRTSNLDQLYRQAIILGRAHLGFDRLGLMLYDEISNEMVGTYGTDGKGNLRDERYFRAPINERIKETVSNQERFGFWGDVTLYDNNVDVGKGWNAMAVLWNGTKSTGWLVVDNLINREPPYPYEIEILTLYGSMLGHLIPQKQAEETLRASEENLRTTLNSIGDAVITTDTAGNITRMNPVAEKLTGWTFNEVKRQPLTDIINIMHTKTGDTAVNPVQTVLKSGQTVEFATDTILVARDNTNYQIASSAAPIQDNDGLTTGVVLVIRDVNEEYQMRQALLESEQNSRIFQEKLQILHEINIELSRTPDLATLYHQAILLGREQLGFDRLGLLLYDEATNEMLGTFGTDDHGEIRDERYFRAPVYPPKILDIIKHQKRSALWEDASLLDESKEVGHGWNAMAVLWNGDKGIGWLAADNLINKEPPYPYQIEILTLYGAALGHLITQKEAEEALRKAHDKLEVHVAERTIELQQTNEQLALQVTQNKALAERHTTLFRISAIIAGIVDEDEICERAVKSLYNEGLGYLHSGLFLIEPETGDRILRASAGQNNPPKNLRLKSGRGISEQAILSGKLQYTPDVTQAKNYIADLKTGSEVDIPIIIDQDVIGVLVVQSPQPHAFDQDDLDNLTTIGTQIGIALGRARLFKETEILYQASVEINQATSYNDILSVLRRHTLLGKGAQNISINIFDIPWTNETLPTKGVVVCRWSQLPLAALKPEYLIADIPSSYEILKSTEPTLIEDIATYPALDENFRNLYLNQFKARSTIFAPLVIGNKWIGIINAIYQQPTKFRANEVRHLMAMVNQLSIAIDNIGLFEQTQQALANTSLLYEATGKLNIAQSYDDILNVLRQYTIVGNGASNIGLIRFNQPKSKSETPLWGDLKAYWTSRKYKRIKEKVYYAEYPSFFEFLKSDDITFIEDVNQAPQLDNNLRKLYAKGLKVKSVLFVPMVVGGEWIGYLNSSYPEPINFTENDIQELKAILQQASVAVQNQYSFEFAQKQAEEAQKARETAVAANEAKSIFLANMSHELRTPLNAILGFSQLIARSANVPPEHQENLQIINRSGAHLLTLINNILDLSKIEAGRLSLHKSNFDLYLMLDDIEDMFRLRAAEKQLHLIFQQSLNVYRYIRTDEVKLRQILINLLNNALKFTQHGGIQVNVDFVPARSTIELPQLLFEVADSGIGIHPEEIDNIFDAFVRTQTGRDAKQGTGLGLTLSRQFVQMMGGDIQVSSQSGQGTRFQFNIEVDIVTETDVEIVKSSKHVIALKPNQPSYRVLVVDDDPRNRKLMVQLLEPVGFVVKEAENGRMAVNIWQEWQPDLIWMDIRMPIMDGYEATKIIKSTEKGKNTPILALTASSFEEDKASILAIGCDEFVRKPFQQEQLFELMRTHLDAQYIYKEAKENPAVSDAFIPTVFSAAAFSNLPSQLLTDLKAATMETNMLLIDKIIRQIETYDPQIAKGIQTLANDFEYQQILTLLDKNS